MDVDVQMSPQNLVTIPVSVYLCVQLYKYIILLMKASNQYIIYSRDSSLPCSWSCCFLEPKPFLIKKCLSFSLYSMPNCLIKAVYLHIHAMLCIPARHSMPSSNMPLLVPTPFLAKQCLHFSMYCQRCVHSSYIVSLVPKPCYQQPLYQSSQAEPD